MMMKKIMQKWSLWEPKILKIEVLGGAWAPKMLKIEVLGGSWRHFGMPWGLLGAKVTKKGANGRPKAPQMSQKWCLNGDKIGQKNEPNK